MSSARPTLVDELGHALREVRYRLRLSQRELAEQLGVSKTWVGRLESGEVSGAVAAVSRLVGDLGLRLSLDVDDAVVAPRGAAPTGAADSVAQAPRGSTTATASAEAVPDLAAPADRPSPRALAELDAPDALDGTDAPQDRIGAVAGPSGVAALTPHPRRGGRRAFTNDPEAVAQVERWRTRVEREHVRDAAGRRLPAHLVAFPMSYPHHWWFLRHHGWSLRKRPIWSFVHGTPLAHSVRQIGDNPPPMGLHPDGGWPMQGRPGPAVRAEWPPTFPVRPRRYADPLEAV